MDILRKVFNEIFNRDLKRILIREYRYCIHRAIRDVDIHKDHSHMRKACKILTELDHKFFSVSWDILTDDGRLTLEYTKKAFG